MGLVWYFLGLWEKHDRPEIKTLYRTKGAYLSVVLSSVVMGLIPFFAWLAPYNYNHNAPFMSTLPILFVLLAVVSLLAVNSAPALRRHEGVLSLFCGLVFVYAFVLAMVAFVEFMNVYLGDSSKWLQTTSQYGLNAPTLEGPGLVAV